MSESELFEVAPDMQKHLSRNVPRDFAEYLGHVDRTLRGNQSPSRQGVAQAIERMARSVRIESDDQLTKELNTLVEGVGLRYEALNRSVDFSVAPRPIYQALDHIISSMMKTADVKLADTHRDERVAADRGLMNIDEFDVGNIQFTDAKSLAEKASMARLKLLQAADELREIRDHFEYKMGKNTAGKPGHYAMIYGVFALGDFFEAKNEFGNKASVNYFEERHSGRFLTFTTSFFAIVNPQVANLAGDTFPEAVRKIAQKRSRDPDCYKLLNGHATTQDLLDFMDRVDRLR